MILRMIQLWLTAVFLTLAARAATLEEVNALYAAGNYSGAATACEELIMKEGPSASRLYTLGNARMQLKEHGPAILAYERALLLAPRDSDIRANLKAARTAAGVAEEREDPAWWEYPLHWFSLAEWSWITIVAAVLAGAGLAAGGFAGAVRRRSWMPALVPVFAGGLLLGSLGGFALWHRRGEKDLGIVTSPGKATLRLSPFTSSDAAGDCGAGRTVILGECVSGWVYVRPTGSSTAGWLPEGEAPALMAP